MTRYCFSSRKERPTYKSRLPSVLLNMAHSGFSPASSLRCSSQTTTSEGNPKTPWRFASSWILNPSLSHLCTQQFTTGPNYSAGSTARARWLRGDLGKPGNAGVRRCGDRERRSAVAGAGHRLLCQRAGVIRLREGQTEKRFNVIFSAGRKFYFGFVQKSSMVPRCHSLRGHLALETSRPLDMLKQNQIAPQSHRK